MKKNWNKEFLEYFDLLEERTREMREGNYERVNNELTPRILEIEEKYGSELGGRMINCQTCVMAYISTQLGTPRYPLPNNHATYGSDDGVFSLLDPKKHNNTGHYMYDYCWNSGLFYLDEYSKPLDMWRYDINFVEHYPLRAYGMLLEKVQEGVHYELDVCFENFSHALYCTKNKRGIKVYDPQSDETYYNDEIADLFKEHGLRTDRYGDYFVLMPVTRINDEIADKCSIKTKK